MQFDTIKNLRSRNEQLIQGTLRELKENHAEEMRALRFRYEVSMIFYYTAA